MSSIRNLVEDLRSDCPQSKLYLWHFILLYFSPKFRVLFNYRIGNYFYKRNGFFFKKIAALLRTRLITRRNCDFAYSATIGKNLNLPHPLGIVVGEGVVIKDNVTVFQHVTLGSHGRNETEMKYPVIESGVKIFAGAKIIGGVTIGENSVIGANAVVNINIPANSTAVGIPCKIINTK